MKATRFRLAPNCLESDGVFECDLALPISESDILALSGAGALEYHRDFPCPLFRLRFEGAEVKGVLGGRTCRVTLPRERRASALQRIRTLLSYAEEPQEGGLYGSQAGEVL